MRKHRSWLMGFGIGLMLGAAMLQLILFSEKQAQIISDKPMTEQQLKTEADRAGFAIIPANELRYTQEQLDKQLAKAVSDARAKWQAESSAGNETTQSNGVRPTNPGDAPTRQQAEELKLYKFEVKRNMTLSEVIGDLAELGLVKDSAAFAKAAVPVAKELQIGYAYLHTEMTNAQMIAELIRKK